MGFGSGVVEPETGIILQNRGHLFSLDENHPNCIGPHKRCVHTLMPGMIFTDGKPYAALGLKGGHVQPQVQVQLISNLIDHGMTPQAGDRGAALQSYRRIESRLGAGNSAERQRRTDAPRPSSRRRQSGELRRRAYDSHPPRVRRLRRRLRPAQGRLRAGILISQDFSRKERKVRKMIPSDRLKSRS